MQQQNKLIFMFKVFPLHNVICGFVELWLLVSLLAVDFLCNFNTVLDTESSVFLTEST